MCEIIPFPNSQDLAGLRAADLPSSQERPCRHGQLARGRGGCSGDMEGVGGSWGCGLPGAPYPRVRILRAPPGNVCGTGVPRSTPCLRVRSGAGRWAEGGGPGGHVAPQECAGAWAERGRGTGGCGSQWAPGTVQFGQSRREGGLFPWRGGPGRIPGRRTRGGERGARRDGRLGSRPGCRVSADTGWSGGGEGSCGVRAGWEWMVVLDRPLQRAYRGDSEISFFLPKLHFCPTPPEPAKSCCSVESGLPARPGALRDGARASRGAPCPRAQAVQVTSAITRTAARPHRLSGVCRRDPRPGPGVWISSTP